MFGKWCASRLSSYLPATKEPLESVGGRHRVGNHDDRTWLLQRLERLSATALRVLRRERNRHQHRLLRVEPRVGARSLWLGALSEQGRTSIRRRHGAIHYGLGVFLGSFADGSLSFLYVTYGFVATVGLGLAFVAPVTALPRWFPERPGFAYGVAVVGFGIGPAANVPLMSGLLSATGGPLETFYVLGIVYAVSSAPPPGSCGTRSKIVTRWADIWRKASRPYRIGTRRRGACGSCATP